MTVDSPYYESQSPYYQGHNDYAPGIDWRSGQPPAPDDAPYGGEWRRQWGGADPPVFSGAFGLYGGGETDESNNGPSYWHPCSPEKAAFTRASAARLGTTRRTITSRWPPVPSAKATTGRR